MDCIPYDDTTIYLLQVSMLNYSKTLNYFKALFTQPKIEYKPPIAMTRESTTMLWVLELAPNEWVSKQSFYDAGVHNPGRAKSTLVRKYDKLILCKVIGTEINARSWWMLITNPFEARRNMTDKDREKYILAHLYNEMCK